MHVIHATNVCQALSAGVIHLTMRGKLEETRNGPALVSVAPVMTVTSMPTQRVLFSPVRDANPFFHMFESIWMLAGRSDSASLIRFVKRFSEFAEPSGEIHGAYGERWRRNFGYDQLRVVIDKLRLNPQDRQAVITMWDPADPYLGADDLMGVWRDRPCNTHIYLRVHSAEAEPFSPTFTGEQVKMLDMTVCCRSNDAIWGTHGANAVHFSVLQEYLAARIGVSVGMLYQLSNNYHAYMSEIERLMKRAKIKDKLFLSRDIYDDRYNKLTTQLMFNYPDRIDEDIRTACRLIDDDEMGKPYKFGNKWFAETFAPAMFAHSMYRKGGKSAVSVAATIVSPDWREACVEWLERRS